MHKRDLLLEIGLEEIPARFVLDSVEQLAKKITDWLQERTIGFSEVKLYSTPRRLAVLIEGVDEAQQDVEQEAKGPAKKIALDQENKWTKAAIGFAKSQGLSTDDIYFKEIKGTEYAHVTKFQKGEKTFDILSGLDDIIESLHFPNNMRWGSQNLKYIRPIRWIVALYGHDIIQISVAGVQASNQTYGHRFLGKNIQLIDPAEYEDKLMSQYVIASYEKRRAVIQEQISKLSAENEWVIPTDKDLLEEVTNLVEYPTAFFGAFNENFLELPEEVLITSMKEHQRYFPVKNTDGKLLPYFIGVRNGNQHNLEIVRRGNEKVLRARLSDADFFFDEDKKLSIDVALKKLENIIYHEKLGTLSEKVSRITKTADLLSELLSLPNDQRTSIRRASQICKFDLVTNMVGEFPELQGIMGEKYALIHGETTEIAQAIREHYQPVHVDDSAPTSTVGAVVSIADKLDSIISSFSIGLIPTGSQDPYALRRQATGIVKILLDKEWEIPMDILLKQAILISGNDQQANQQELYLQLVKFFKQRFHYLLEEKGIRYDIIEAVLNSEWKSAPDIINRAEILNDNKEKAEFKEVIESLSRVLNIAEKSEQDSDADPSLFENDVEKQLFEHWKSAKSSFDSNQSADERFKALSSLQPIISDYFDHTMVMAKNEQLKVNRLSQMKQLAKLIGSFAAMNKIIVK
ncbi:glycine--tRNA ligase subunit beta [Bacillus niameyensis]|uniref:glycine--tRNA ligase subunit beta n=1 Tax=Bacillus niameyensis TaxID=1522308 RepID=UPI000781232D|nr:glycine--tRNA ligase subunit beta [Bacillus niameyensis]